jgi:hypothetical protein
MRVQDNKDDPAYGEGKYEAAEEMSWRERGHWRSSTVATLNSISNLAAMLQLKEAKMRPESCIKKRTTGLCKRFGCSTPLSHIMQSLSPVGIRQ